MYRLEEKMRCLEFECDTDLKQYVDSMLFDEVCIATGVFENNNKTLTIDLKVCGDVSVTFKGEIYRTPSEFPDELIDIIRKHPNDWEYYSPSGEKNDNAEGDVYVGLNNWFEYVFDGDGEVYEEDLSKANPEAIKRDMQKIAAQYFGIPRGHFDV